MKRLFALSLLVLLLCLPDRPHAADDSLPPQNDASQDATSQDAQGGAPQDDTSQDPQDAATQAPQDPDADTSMDACIEACSQVGVALGYVVMMQNCVCSDDSSGDSSGD